MDKTGEQALLLFRTAAVATMPSAVCFSFGLEKVVGNAVRHIVFLGVSLISSRIAVIFLRDAKLIIQLRIFFFEVPMNAFS